MSGQSNGPVAHIFITPRAFERSMTAAENEVVEQLVRSFKSRIAGERLVVAAQALGQLTADYAEQISQRGGDTVCAIQDIASRGQDWVQAGDAAKAVVSRARQRMASTMKRKKKVG